MIKPLDQLLGHGTEARLRYKDAEYAVIISGDYVKCAVTGRAIPLEKLRYWSVDRQEAYADARVSVERHREMVARDRSKR
ncbi:MAG: DUF2093 domain-containing protein [Pseudomonadota bacterium]